MKKTNTLLSLGAAAVLAIGAGTVSGCASDSGAKKEAEGSCGGDKKAEGEGSCGGDKAAEGGEKAAEGGEKAAEGSCGEGSCG